MVEHESTGLMDRLSLAISRIAMFVTGFIVLIIFYEVVMRYVFAKPTIWVNEMSLWLGGVTYLLAGVYVMQQRGHIRIFILYDMVPRNVQRLFDVLSTLCICIFCAAIIYGGWTEAWQKMMRWETFGTAWDPPIPATIKPLVIFTAILLALQAISNLIADWGKDKEMHSVIDEDVVEELKH